MLNRSLRTLLDCSWLCCSCELVHFVGLAQDWRQHCEAVAFSFERVDRSAEYEDGDAVHLHVERRLERMMAGKRLRSMILSDAYVSILYPCLRSARAMMRTLAVRKSGIQEEGEVG